MSDRDELVAKIGDIIEKLVYEHNTLSKNDTEVNSRRIVDLIEQHNRNDVLDEAIEAVYSVATHPDNIGVGSVHTVDIVKAIESKKVK